jgi:hypothetical protein
MLRGKPCISLSPAALENGGNRFSGFAKQKEPHFKKWRNHSVKISTMVTLAATLLAGNSAYGQAGAQANASTGSTGSVQANKSAAQASGNSATSSSASAQDGQNSTNLSNRTTMNAALSQPIDAKKNKPGDPVTAKTTEAARSEGKVVIPKGSRLVGHVTEAKARTKGESGSALGLVFDKAILKNGQEVPLNMTVQAIATANNAASTSVGGDDLSAGGAMAGGATARASGGALGGVTSTAGAGAGTITNTAANVNGIASSTGGRAINSTSTAAGGTHGATGGLNAAGHLTSNSQGVFGLEGVHLNSPAASNTQGSLLTSTTRNVHLDSGTQLLLVAHGQASANR